MNQTGSAAYDAALRVQAELAIIEAKTRRHLSNEHVLPMADTFVSILFFWAEDRVVNALNKRARTS